MLPGVFDKFLLILPLLRPTTVPPNNGDYNYDNPNADWGDVNPICNGSYQSPINLSQKGLTISPLRRLTFGNYDVPLAGKVYVKNDGKTANIDLPVTKNGERAYISGGLLNGRFEAVGAHFHWGDYNNKGSEHTINNRRFDMELHIVHKNSKYATVDEAIQYKDGLAVLGILLKRTADPDRFYPGLNKIFNELPYIKEYDTRSQIQGILTLGQLLGDVDTDYFFTYQGSLTTPPCAEAVTWQVFPRPLVISPAQNYLFFDLLTKSGEPLVDNYRPLQPRNGRPLFFRKPLLNLNPVI